MTSKTIGMICVLFIAFCFFSCDSDSCESVLCLNGGTCLDGDCDCPPGFGGANCAETVDPTAIVIKSVQIKRWPVKTPTFETWDPEDGPDLYLDIYLGASLVPSFTSEVFPEAQAGDDMTIFADYSHDFKTGESIRLWLWDEDDGEDDLVTDHYKGYIHPKRALSDNPNEFTYDDGEVRLDMKLEYIFN